MAIDKNYRIGFRLLARKDVSIEDAIEAVKLATPSISILRIFGRNSHPVYFRQEEAKI